MINRREFFKFTSKSIALSGVSYLTLPSSLQAAAPLPEFDEYKALVCVMLRGGNDSLNMFVPCGDDANSGYDMYASIRGNLTVANSDLTPDLDIPNPYFSDGNIQASYLKGFYRHGHIDGLATNALMPEIARLVNNHKIAIVANMGTLVEPTTKEQIESSSIQLPYHLFAHNHQRRIIENGVANNLNELGWAGRLFDEWKGINSNNLYPMNISFAGRTYLFNAKKTSPLVLSKKGPSDSYSSMSGAKETLYNDLNSLTYESPFKGLYNFMLNRSFVLLAHLKSDWDNSHEFTTTNSYGINLFETPTADQMGLNSSISDSFSNQLKSVAKMIKIGKDRGLKRQIFYVQMTGFDTHSGQLQKHPKLLRTLSLGMGDFQAALAEIDMEDKVTTFNVSDFGRSTGNNGDGTDHAWGGHYFVMGGAVNSGLYGTLPNLTLSGPDDISTKGRLIPTTSSDEYLSTILTWYGVDAESKNRLLPNLNNFNNPNLGFLNS